jgi:cytochrome c556
MVMFEIDYARRNVEPHLRNATRLRMTGAELQRMRSWTDHDAFQSWREERLRPGRGVTEEDGERFEAWRIELSEGLDRAIVATDAGDLDALREHWITVSQTCIKCHKRYQPTY